MKPSLKNRILAYIRKQEGFVNGGELERLGESVGFKASNVSRRCRELHNEGLLERKIEKSQYSKIASVWYAATPPKEIIKYCVPSLGLKFEKRNYE